MCLIMDGTQVDLPRDAVLHSNNTISMVYMTGEQVWKRTIPFLAKNEAFFLERLQGSYCPELMATPDKYTVVMRRVFGASVEDTQEFYRNCLRCANHLEARGIQHGDLTRPNVLVVADSPIILDWSEARLRSEGRAPKRPGKDKDWLLITAKEIIREQQKQR